MSLKKNRKKISNFKKFYEFMLGYIQSRSGLHATHGLWIGEAFIKVLPYEENKKLTFVFFWYISLTYFS